MNFLSIFVLIPLLMLLGLWLSRNIAQIRAVMVAGASALLVAAVGLTVVYLQARHGGATDEMLFRADVAWYPALNIHYSVGVDGISVAMLLLSAIIVFTGTFASWRLQPLTKEYFLWFTLLSMGVFGFFISTDLFTMFMFYEVALIPYSFLWGDMIRIPLPGGSGLGILFYARSNVAYLFGDKWCWQTAYKILALIMLFSGGIAAYTFVWDLGDVGIGLMTIFNIIFLYPLSGQALNELKEYEAEKKNKKDRN